MAISQITSNSIAAGAVSASDLADSSITPAKLSTGAPYWDTSGNVGVGTSSPSYKFQVVGATSAFYFNNSTNNITLDGNGTNRDLNFYFRYSSSATIQSDSDLRFQSNNTERMKIDSSGNIYVGTDTTCNLLDFRSKSLGTNGYQKLAGGLIIQWGVNNVNINQTAVTITLPIAFPTACCSVVATISGANNVIGNGVGQVQTNSFSTTTFNIFGDYTSATATNVPTSWIAIGY